MTPSHKTMNLKTTTNNNNNRPKPSPSHPLPSPQNTTPSPLSKCFQLNKIFWITILVSVCIISYYTTGNTVNSYVSGIFTCIFIAFWGYLVHYISHSTNHIKIYQESEFPLFVYLRKNKFINTIIETSLKYTIDFHAIIHHDTSINKIPSNIIVEAVQNFLSQGALLMLLNNRYLPILQFQNTSLKITLNNSILMLWALLYATVHNINYNINHPTQHINHHIDPKTNYGIDILDVLFNTKYQNQNTSNNTPPSFNTTHASSLTSHPISDTTHMMLEDNNHAAINIILITIYLIWPYLS